MDHDDYPCTSEAPSTVLIYSVDADGLHVGLFAAVDFYAEPEGQSA